MEPVELRDQIGSVPSWVAMVQYGLHGHAAPLLHDERVDRRGPVHHLVAEFIRIPSVL